MKVLGHQLDILIAAVVALSFGALTLIAFSSVVELEKPAFTLLGSLTHGENSFSIVRDGQCTGEASATVVSDDRTGTHVVTGNVSIGVLVREQRIDPSIKFELHFNPLGQLTIGQIQIAVADTPFTILLTEANPIKISAWYGSAATTTKLNLEVPGPLLFLRTSSSTFSIGYPIRGGRLPPMLQALSAHRDFKDPAITIPQVIPDKHCAGAPIVPFDLTPIVIQAEKFGPSFGLPSALTSGAIP